VLIEANTRSLTTNRAAFYVAISRPRYELKLYTDRAAELRGAVARVPKKFAALELRTAHSEAHIAEQKHRQISISRLRNLSNDLQRRNPNPQPAQANRSVALGRTLR